MPFKDYSNTPASNTELEGSIFIGQNMARNDVRPALQQLAADGRDLYDTVIAMGANGTLPQYIQSVSGAAVRTVQDKLQERISVLDILTGAERSEVLAGTNTALTSAKMAALFAEVHANRPGAIIDATMVRGTWIWAANPFAALTRCNVVLMTGTVNIKMDFNLNLLLMPSFFNWQSLGTTRISPLNFITELPVAQRGPGFSIVGTRNFSTTGSGVAGTRTVTVASGAIFDVGSVLLVDGGEVNAYNNFTLDGAINSSTTALAFNETTVGTIQGTPVYLKIGSELIAGTATGLTFTATQRGALGTTAASHADNAAVSVMQAFLTEVTGVSGTTISIADALPVAFTGATIWTGTVDTTLTGKFVIDGEFDRDNVGGFFYNIAAPLASGFKMSGGVKSLNGMHGAIYLAGAFDADVDIDEIAGCGQPGPQLGGDIWIYGQCRRARVRVRACRDGYVGWYIDNKSFGHYLYDGEAKHNWIEIGSLIGYVGEGQISGSSENTVTVGYAETSSFSVIADDSTGQTTAPVPTQRNSIMTRAQATVRAPTGNAIGNNTISFNGRSVRRVEFTHTTTADRTVTANVNDNYAVTATGVKAGDKVDVSPVAALPGVLGVSGYSVANDEVRIILSATNADVVLPSGTQFLVKAEGPW